MRFLPGALEAASWREDQDCLQQDWVGRGARQLEQRRECRRKALRCSTPPRDSDDAGVAVSPCSTR